MKILQVSALYFPHVGGIENHVHQLSRNLVKRGHDVTVYTSNVPKGKKYEIIDGIKIHRFRSLISPLNNQIAPEMLLSVLKNNQFDVIHAHGYLQLTTNIAAISALKNKIPLVITSHGTVEYNGWKRLVNYAYNKTIGKWTMCCADTVIALSPSQSLILNEIGVERIDIVPNGTNFNKIEVPTGIEEFKFRYELNDKMIILYVGSLIPRKGVEYLIDAMKKVERGSILLIIGDSLKGTEAYKEKLLNLITSEKIDNVIYVGRVDEDTLKIAYYIADIFVLPSLSEGLPTVLLEAMAYRKAVVASDISGNNDLIVNNENGLLFEKTNSDQLADSINNLIQSADKRIIFGLRSHDKVVKDYSWNTITSEIISVYQKVMKNDDAIFR